MLFVATVPCDSSSHPVAIFHWLWYIPPTLPFLCFISIASWLAPVPCCFACVLLTSYLHIVYRPLLVSCKNPVRVRSERKKERERERDKEEEREGEGESKRQREREREGERERERALLDQVSSKMPGPPATQTHTHARPPARPPARTHEHTHKHAHACFH